MLRQSPATDAHPPRIQGITQDISTPRTVVHDPCYVQDSAREPISHLTGKKPITKQVMRLVRPAILTYEQRGTLRQVLIPLTVEGFDAIPMNRRLALLDYILKLRLFFWPIDRIQVHGSAFVPRAQRSILYEESRMASALDFHFFCIGIANGQLFSTIYLLYTFVGTMDGIHNGVAVVKCLSRDFGGMLGDGIAFGAQIYWVKIKKLSEASKMPENQLKRVDEQHRNAEGEILEIQDRISKAADRASTTTQSSRRETTSIAHLQSCLMMMFIRKSDLGYESSFIARTNIQTAEITNSFFKIRNRFGSLISGDATRSLHIN